MPVSTKLAYEIFYIEFWHILSLLLILSVNYYIALKARKTPLLYSYFSAQAMLVIWIVSKIFKTVSPNIQLRWFFIVTQYFGVSFLGAALVVFAFIYSKKKLPTLRQLFLWSIPAVYSFIVVLTNPLHYRMYATFNFYSDTFGDLFYFNMAVSYIYLMAAIFMLARGFLKMFGKERMRAYLFAVGIIIPLIINVFYVANLFEAFFNYSPLFDYTPIATNISLIFFTLAAYRYRFLDILPMAGQQMFDGISDAVAITDKNGKIANKNTSFSKIFPKKSQGENLPDELFDEVSDILRINDSIFKLSKKQKNKMTIIRLSDTTGVYAILNLLKIKNTELSDSHLNLEKLLAKKNSLAELKMRNYILQELHDILGHATVLAISACEVALLSGATDYISTLSGVKTLLEDGKNELENVLKAQESSKERTSMLIRLEELVNSTNDSQLKTELIVQGTVFDFGSNSSEAVYRLCQEAVTNSIKHSGASTLSFIIRYNENDIEIFAIDNGRGCESINYGKGLDGMAGRFAKLGGELEITSDLDCGFHIYAKMPLA